METQKTILEEISKLQSDLLTMEIGSPEYIKTSNVIANLYNSVVELSKTELGKDQIISNEKIESGNRKTNVLTTILKVVGEGAVAVGIAILGHAFNMREIDEISNFERNDSYTGKKAAFLPKGRKR